MAPAPAPAPAVPRSREVRVLLAGALLTRASAFGYPFLSYRMTRDLGMPTADAAMVLAVFGVGMGLGQLACGFACDRLGPRTTLLAAMLLAVVVLPALGTTHSLPALVVGAALAGATYDAVRPVAGAVTTAMVADNGERARIAGWRHWAVNVGAAATGAGGLLARYTGLPVLFAANAAGCAFFAVMVCSCLPAGRLPGKPPGETQGGYGRALADPRLLLLCAASLGGLTCVVGLLAALPLLMARAGLSTTAYGAIQICNAGTVIALTPVFNPWLARRAAAGRPLVALLATGSALLGLALGAAALGTTTPVIAVAVAASIPGEIVLMVAASDVLNRIAPPRQLGRYNGIWGTTIAAAGVTAPLLTSWALAHGGQATAALALLAAGLTGPAFCLPLARSIRRHTTVTPPAAGPPTHPPELLMSRTPPPAASRPDATTATVAVAAPFGTGAHYAAAFRGHGLETIAITLPDPELPPAYRGRLDPAPYRHVITHTSLETTVGRLDGEGIIGVVAGTEIGVPLADHLNHALGLPGNHPATTAARRSKTVMAHTLARAGVAAPRTFETANPDEAIAWAQHHNLTETVVKPVDSAGSDGLHFCAGPGDVRTAWQALHHTRHAMGGTNDRLVVQELLRGRQFIVNTVSTRRNDGTTLHTVTETWTDQRATSQRLYDRQDLACADAAATLELAAYASRVLDALGVTIGPAHSEIMWTPDRGPS